MGKLKQTWEYIENGCPTCNARGLVERVCSTWNDPAHTARTCRGNCQGGTVYSTCPACGGYCLTR